MNKDVTKMMDHYDITTDKTGRKYIRLVRIAYNSELPDKTSDDTYRITTFGEMMELHPLREFLTNPELVYEAMQCEPNATVESVTESKMIDIMSGTDDSIASENTETTRTYMPYRNLTLNTPCGEYCCEEDAITKIKLLDIKVKYFSDVTPINFTEKGDWIDLRSSKDITLKAGEFALIPLGVGMKLPDGYEAHLVPRSSTFKNYGIIQTNHMGVIDNSYSGDNDEWKMPVYAIHDTVIHKNDRICQFRIMESMQCVTITPVKHLSDTDRGGFGSTGVK